ncbi:MAG: Verru_Chthon cassette protein C [Verrucomicrobiota bacterium]
MKTKTSSAAEPEKETKKLKAFSMIELMLAMTILAAMLLMFVGVLDQTQKSWDYAQGQISQFREARVAFDIMTKNLSQATLNAYYDMVDLEPPPDGDGVPERFEITSELHFKVFNADELTVSGHKPGHALFFQAPLGVTGNRDYYILNNLLNARAYYVAFNSDREFRPPFLTQYDTPERLRYRLMEWIPPTERNMIYVDGAKETDDPDFDPKNPKFNEWFRDASNITEFSRPLAENVVALIISPREPVTDALAAANPARAERESFQRIAPKYEFDSEKPEDPRFRHLLPPLVKVTMVAIDETTAIRYEDSGGGGSSPYMQTHLNGKFESALNYQTDLDDLMDAFHSDDERDGLEVRYKIFSTNIAIMGSKWSADPQKDSTGTP